MYSSLIFTKFLKRKNASINLLVIFLVIPIHMYVIVTQKANIKNVMYASKRQLEIIHESMPCM